jgi:DNA-binding transcriptional MerR regulator
MKYYYSISEVSEKTSVKAHVLRYWEKEFRQLRPKKSKTGRRTYTEKDIELISLINKLLREEHYTIEGVRERLKSGESRPDVDKSALKDVRKALEEILDILSE